MTIRQMFHAAQPQLLNNNLHNNHTHTILPIHRSNDNNRHNQIVEEEPKKIPKFSTLNIVDDLESPFMNIRYSCPCPETPAPSKPPPQSTTPPPIDNNERVPFQPINNETRQVRKGSKPLQIPKIPKDCTPFFLAPPSPERDPYASLKLNDEMINFYHSTLVNKKIGCKLTRPELKLKIELIREKHHQVCNAMNYGISEFNFIFRDFIGHLTMIIEYSRFYNWTIEFLLPFLQNVRKTPNSLQAFGEITRLIKELCEYQIQESNLAHSMATTVWTALILSFQSSNQQIRELSSMTLKSIVKTSPCANGELCRKVVLIRTVTPEYYTKGMSYFRILTIDMLKILNDRLLREFSMDILTVQLLREIIQEANETYKAETNPLIIKKLFDYFDLKPHEDTPSIQATPSIETAWIPPEPQQLLQPQPQPQPEPETQPQRRTGRNTRPISSFEKGINNAPAAARIRHHRHHLHSHYTTGRVNKPPTAKWIPSKNANNYQEVKWDQYTNKPNDSPSPHPPPVISRFRTKTMNVKSNAHNFYNRMQNRAQSLRHRSNKFVV